MGSSRWSDADWTSTVATRSTMSREQIFTNRNMKTHLDPKGILLRESCDSDVNPRSNAIILGLDVSGSMGVIAEKMAKEGLGQLISGIYERKPVEDPHVMIMAIGDVDYDRAPLQVSQFEADIKISDQLAELWLESGGGGNSHESYDLPWYFAAHKTTIDCFNKRSKKGYLFTIGDEETPTGVSKAQLKTIFGDGDSKPYTSSELLAQAEEKYNVFHIIVEEGNHARHHLTAVTNKWRQLLGKHAILLDNYNYVSQVILSVLDVAEGADPETVVASWQDKAVQKTVRHALFD